MIFLIIKKISESLLEIQLLISVNIFFNSLSSVVKSNGFNFVCKYLFQYSIAPLVFIT